MLTIALACLLGGAAGGLFMAYRHFTHRSMPPVVATLHGVLGATGLVILLLYPLAQPTFDIAAVALLILVAAALVGFVNLTYHLRRRRHRSALIVVHALVAVTGAATLLYAILTGP